MPVPAGASERYPMIAKALSQNLTGYARGNPTIMAESSVSDKRRRSKDAGGVRRRELPLVSQTDARQRESSTVTAAKTRNETEKRTPRRISVSTASQQPNVTSTTACVVEVVEVKKKSYSSPPGMR